MGWPLVAAAAGLAVVSGIMAKRADDDRVKHEEAQRKEITRAVNEAFAVNKKNLEISRIRSQEQVSRDTLTALGSLRAQSATRVGRSSTAALSTVLASGTIAATDVRAQTFAQEEVLESQRDQQIAGVPVPQSTPGIAFLGGLQGLQTGLSIASSTKSLTSG